MIKRKSEQVTEVRENMRGGGGSVTIRHYFKKDEISKLYYQKQYAFFFVSAYSYLGYISPFKL